MGFWGFGDTDTRAGAYELCGPWPAWVVVEQGRSYVRVGVDG